MKTETFKPRKFLGMDFTQRKRYRAEIERLERVNRTFAGVSPRVKKTAMTSLKSAPKNGTFVMPLRPNYKSIGVNAAPAGVSSKNKAY